MIVVEIFFSAFLKKLERKARSVEAPELSILLSYRAMRGTGRVGLGISLFLVLL